MQFGLSALCWPWCEEAAAFARTSSFSTETIETTEGLNTLKYTVSTDNLLSKSILGARRQLLLHAHHHFQWRQKLIDFLNVCSFDYQFAGFHNLAKKIYNQEK